MNYDAKSLYQVKKYYSSAIGELADDVLESLSHIEELERENAALKNEIASLQK